MSAVANIGAMPLGIVSAGVAAVSALPRAAATPASSQAAHNAAVPTSTSATTAMPTPAAPTHASVVHPISKHPIGASPSTAGAVGGTVFALLFVVALILALAWLAKRMPGIAKANNPALKLVASLPLGPRERVVVVDVGGTQLLLGVGVGGTRTLHTLDAPLPVVDREKLNVPPFAQLLAQHFGKKS